MTNFLTVEKTSWKCYLEIDTKLFKKDIILKAAYQFLDQAYFFFRINSKNNIELQLTLRDKDKNCEEILADFSDELLSVYLRDKLEKDNKDIREKIVWVAIANSLDSSNFVEINTDLKQNKEQSQEQNQVDFDKDIDEILKEIENDPELKIDEEEIENILKEIEEETETEIETKGANDK